MSDLEQFGNIPLSYAALADMIPDYRSPADKVASMERRGDIVRLKKGMYVVSEKISRKAVCRELIANHLYGPSYISLESALSHYGLIPERVYVVRSVTPKRSKRYTNAFGNFDYTTVPAEYFSIGIRQHIIHNDYAYLIASPEKALCDMILATPRLRLQSLRAMQTYLEEDLRIDLTAVDKWDTEIVRMCTKVGMKKNELNVLIKHITR